MRDKLFKIESELFKIESEAYKNKKIRLGLKIEEVRKKIWEIIKSDY